MIRRPNAARFAVLAALVLLCELAVAVLPAQAAATYAPITGTGSTWSQNALDQWRSNVARNYGMTVNYSGVGSTSGRRDFIDGTIDFAISEIPFQAAPEDGSAPEQPPRGYAYMPIVAGGTSFMYNLKINGKRVTNLRLSGEAITGIFTGKITTWNDQAIQSDNPALTLPNKKIVPVIRSDGSGTSAQFTLWMSKQYPSLWTKGMTSQYPLFGNAKAQKGSDGVSGYVSQNYGEGAITYVEYSYAKKAGFPVAKVLNKKGYFVEPTASSVAVALTYAKINTDEKSANYLTQILDDVYDNTDPRSYPLSSYSYAIVPTEVQGIFNAEKGNTLGAFMRYVLCEGQQQADTLGYSPLPMNLVMAGSDQIKRIPGAGNTGIDTNSCNNPTFKKGDSPSKNQLAQTAVQPAEADQRGSSQCTNGTGGAKQDTAVTGSGTGSHCQYKSTTGSGGNTGGGDNGGSGGGTGGNTGNTGGTGGNTGNNGGTGGNTGGTNNNGGGNGGGGTSGNGGTSNPGTNTPSYDENGELLSNDPGNSGGTGTDGGYTGGTDNSGGTGGGAVASAFTLPDPGMGTAQWLMVAAAGLMVVVVVVPPLVSRRLKNAGGHA